MKLSLHVSPNFNFWRTVYSHGWCVLPPFEVIKESHRLRRIIELSNGKTVIVEIFPHLKSGLVIEIQSNKFLSLKSKPEIISKVKSCLRLEEDYSEFYREAKTQKRFRWVPKTGAGRMLRAPTVFEDVVKMICTTNCSWALTEIMVQNLCKKLGDEAADLQFAFPRPEAIASQTEKFLRKEIRAGYRAPYLLELSRRVVKGDIDLESWRSSNLATNELFDQVRSVKGIGPYAAGNILKLLGRYDYLGIDSWCRAKFFEIHRNGRKGSDRAIDRYYEPFGKWRGLFFWMDVTKEWYQQKFPF
jgi:3-methyladenine DNA glycosylase/8-oxoguanine DNA glycosylase